MFHEHLLGLIAPTLEESVKLTHENLFKKGKDINRFNNLVKDYAYLDNIEWLTHLTQIDGCPQCKTETISYGPDFSYPFAKGLTNAELDKNAVMTRPFA